MLQKYTYHIECSDRWNLFLAVILVKSSQKTKKSTIASKCVDDIYLLLKQFVCVIRQSCYIVDNWPDLEEMLIAIAVLSNHTFNVFLYESINPLLEVYSSDNSLSQLLLVGHDVIQTVFQNSHNFITLVVSDANVEKNRHLVSCLQLVAILCLRIIINAFADLYLALMSEGCLHKHLVSF